MSASFIRAARRFAADCRPPNGPPCRCRATPDADELAGNTGSRTNADDLDIYALHILKSRPDLSHSDAVRQAARNYHCGEVALREVRRAAGLEELAALPLPPAESTIPSAEMPMVSVLTPTTACRHWSHATLYACFKSQRGVPQRELLILDSGGPPSPFFTTLSDRRVRYFHSPIPPASVRTIGGKRNWLAQRARGQVLASFDDDDVYLPSYLRRMVSALHFDGADLVKLASWISWDARNDSLARYDAEMDTGLGWHSRWWGYGFSFVVIRPNGPQIYPCPVHRAAVLSHAPRSPRFHPCLFTVESGACQVLPLPTRRPRRRLWDGPPCCCRRIQGARVR